MYVGEIIEFWIVASFLGRLRLEGLMHEALSPDQLNCPNRLRSAIKTNQENRLTPLQIERRLTYLGKKNEFD
jgi:hypothetical protein